MNFAHTSVLIHESMGLLKPRPGERYLDGVASESG
jgi:16S rRNA C1402 N4-methylase RsmH